MPAGPASIHPRRMRRSFHRGNEVWELATGLDPLPAPAERFIDESDARRFLLRIAAEEGTAGLRAVLGSESPWLDVRRMDDAEVTTRLARALLSGAARVARKPLPEPSRFPLGGGSGGSAGATSQQMTPRQWEAAARAERPLPAPRTRPAATAAAATEATEATATAAAAATATTAAAASTDPPASTTDWIEVQLVGEDDAPLPGERFVVTLPDGSTRKGVTDDDGLARLEGIPSGTCHVSFPDLDRDAWVPV